MKQRPPTKIQGQRFYTFKESEETNSGYEIYAKLPYL